MTFEKYRKSLVWDDFWEFPIRFSDVENITTKEGLVYLIGEEHSSGIQPMVLFNLDLLADLSEVEWSEAIGEAAQIENRFMMGSINAVDTFYKYLKVDIRPIIEKHASIDYSKKKFVIDYYLDCPNCLKVEEEEQQTMINKYVPSHVSLLTVREKLTLIGGEMVN